MTQWLQRLKPYKTVPVTPWSGSHRWDVNFTRASILIFGLFIFGIGDSLLIVSGLGNAPWSVLAQGLSLNLGISIGSSTLLISALVLLLWLPLRERPGFGTIMNILVIAFAIDIGVNFLPRTESFIINLSSVLVGIIFVGTGSALYITCALGPGPRDGWMTAMHRRSGIPVGRVRLMIEVSVLCVGVLLGGTAGLGTALFALLIGYAVAMAFGVVARFTSQ